MRRFLLILAAVLTTGSIASAASWADALFDGLSRDFGSVPRGTVLTHPFRIVNNTGRRLHIANVRVSCGCVTAWAMKHTLAPGEETAIMAKMDTSRFSNSRTVTIFVTIDEPAWAEVRLWVRANSRSDVSVVPDTLAFGRIKRGSSPTRSTTISLYGDPRFRILSIYAESNYVLPSCKLVRRTANELTYVLSAKLRPDTPPGRWYTDIWAKTNNPATPKIRIPLTVEIESSLSVSPAMALLGNVRVGGEEVRKIIVRGVQPFTITRIVGTDKQLEVVKNTDGKRTVHILTIRLRPTRPGQFERTLRIETDLPNDNTIEFTTRAYVVN